ncbi:MAG: PVC-type heme-binding CxxCH protein [Planctomycetota bacterium]
MTQLLGAVTRNFLLALPIAMVVIADTDAAEPRVLIEGAQLELAGREPEIVTPVGMTFDLAGRLLVIESHTHQRSQDYQGPKSDRIRMLSDSNGDGKLDKWSTFAEGFQQSMNIITAGPGMFYLVTRRSVDLLIDADGDGVMDSSESILKLETEENFPHNALGGIALDGKGGMYVGLGENFGVAYKLVGADGSAYSDHGGVGTIFHCTTDGKRLRRFCNGFWNPFSICTLPNGEVFTVDNDPDSSPPCRLIHAVASGDYGHRWEYSRAGIHPLQAWNGELPGTLPMLAGTGEAPCAVLPHRGFLWVTSWGDHRLERYRLTPRGATYQAEQAIAVQGDSDFRPTGCAVAPDGSLYFADWVDHSYPVHGKGRIWRLSFDSDAADAGEVESPTRQADDWRKSVNSADAFERQRIVRGYVQEFRTWPGFLPTSSAERLAQAQAARWHKLWIGMGNEIAILPELLQAPDADTRLYAVRWIADERIQSLRDDVAQLLDGVIPDARYYLQVLSALEWLDGEPKHRRSTLNDGLFVRELKNSSRSPEQHALALRMVSPDNKFLTVDRLKNYLLSDHRPLRLEAVRTLGLQTNPDRFALLADVARDDAQSDQVRAQAISSLAATQEYGDLLNSLTTDESSTIAEEARRVQRLRGLIPTVDEVKPDTSDLTAWNRLLGESGDAEAGRRLFFSAKGARCAVCHQYEGRGGKIGPDLSRIHLSNSRTQIIASILQPSREMAPHYQPWKLQTDAGRTLLALRLHKAGDEGKEIYADSDGNQIRLRGDEIEVREASETSIMPSGLEKTVSIDQLRDLVEFLSTGGS